MHNQWNGLIKKIFEIANDVRLNASERQRNIWKVLDQA
jgi:hypothetical protein